MIAGQPPPTGPDSALADRVTARLTTFYGGAADAERAAPMAAYMRGRFPFFGIPTPERRMLSRKVVRGTARPGEDDCAAVALRCWALEEREYQYFAADYLRRHAPVCSSSFLPVLRFLVGTKAWWDTVDVLAAHVAGPLVAADPALREVMDDWITDDDKWVARTALLHQLRYQERTDAERLFVYCRALAGHPDFFVRKAIGWALREYAKTDADAVRVFVAGHRDALSPLSAREALRNVGGRT